MYDIAIVGGGPAGLAAAVNARRRNKETVLIGKEELSSKLTQSHLIDNYLGMPKIVGRELAETMRAHATNLGTVFCKDEVQSIYQDDQTFNLMGRENAIQAQAVILAVGISLGAEISGEADLVGRGVSYCATCDGMFFKGKTVALVGYIPEAEADLKFLAEICAKVYYLPQYKILNQLDAGIEVLQAKPLAISGSERVELLKTSSVELKLDGVFIERAGRPLDQLCEGLKLAENFIITSETQATNLSGVYAAGDCTGKPWQISRAVGQGQIAALSAVSYLEKIKG